MSMTSYKNAEFLLSEGLWRVQLTLCRRSNGRGLGFFFAVLVLPRRTVLVENVYSKANAVYCLVTP